MTKIKICGLKREEDVFFANEVRPDYIGFVFAPSKRQISPEKAQQFRSLLQADIPAVGVFVNAPEEEILSLAKKGTIQMIQLHGGESRAYIRTIKEKSGLPVIKAVSIQTLEDLFSWQDCAADALLFDQGSGGSGKRFDWNLLKQTAGQKYEGKPFFLAGGIAPENAEEAIRTCHPYALDVSSGVETGGVKDFLKMQSLVRLVRQVHNG